MSTKLSQLLTLIYNHYRDGEFLESLNFSIMDLQRSNIDALGTAKTQIEIEANINAEIGKLKKERNTEGCDIYQNIRNQGNLKFLKQHVIIVAALRDMDMI